MPTRSIRINTEYTWLLWGLSLTQLLLLCMSFPITRLVSQSPLLYIDSPYHWYEIEMAKALATEGQLIGYDPYFAAGYIGGIPFNASAKLPAFLAIVLSPWLDTVIVYKLYVFGAAMLGPTCVPLAMRWLRFSNRDAFAAAVFGLLLWWLSAFRWFHTAGLVSYVLAAYLTLPYSALVTRYLVESMRFRALLLLAGLGAVGFLLHPLFPLLVAPMVIALTIANWRELDLRRAILAYTILPLLCLLPNLLWILPTLQHPGFAVGNPQPYQRAVDISIVWNEALGRITQDARGSRLNIVLLFAALCAVALPTERRTKRVSIGIAVASAFLIVFSALGAALPFVGTLQPNRLSSAAYLDLCIPGGLGVVGLWRWLAGLREFKRPAQVASMGLLALAGAFFARELVRELSYADIPHHGERPPEVQGVGPISASLLNWLKRDTSDDARVLFELSKGRIHDQAHMAGYLALTSNREFVGGPYPYALLTSFEDGELLGRPIESLSQNELSDYLRLYNIGWIVAFSGESKEVLDRMPGVVPREQFGPIQTYAVVGQHTFFLEGSGRIIGRSFNRVELTDLSGSVVVLKYHYGPGLEADPPAHIEPVSEPGDPEPFIRLINPPSHVLLRMR